uniref:Uncharacterized protein n=1 Tax=Cacopsylla melanoneura TaxID=428564 RepID=A0A8D8QCI8_9HEMI
MIFFTLVYSTPFFLYLNTLIKKMTKLILPHVTDGQTNYFNTHFIQMVKTISTLVLDRWPNYFDLVFRRRAEWCSPDFLAKDRHGLQSPTKTDEIKDSFVTELFSDRYAIQAGRWQGSQFSILAFFTFKIFRIFKCIRQVGIICLSSSYLLYANYKCSMCIGKYSYHVTIVTCLGLDIVVLRLEKNDPNKIQERRIQ